MHQDPSGHMSSNFWFNVMIGISGVIATVLAPFTGGSTAVIAAGEVAAAVGTTSGALGAAGAATYNKALQKASLGLGIAGAVIDAVNIIGSGAKLVANGAGAAASDTGEISTTVGGGATKIADGEATEVEKHSQIVGSGMFGDVYEENAGFLVKKGKIGVLNNFKKEAGFFNRLYGEGAAEVLSDGSLRMKKIQGIPLSQIPNADELIPRNKIENMLKELKEKEIHHGDLKSANVLWDNQEQRLKPVDFGKSYQRKPYGDLEYPSFGW